MAWKCAECGYNNSIPAMPCFRCNFDPDLSTSKPSGEKEERDIKYEPRNAAPPSNNFLTSAWMLRAVAVVVALVVISYVAFGRSKNTPQSSDAIAVQDTLDNAANSLNEGYSVLNDLNRVVDLTLGVTHNDYHFTKDKSSGPSVVSEFVLDSGDFVLAAKANNGVCYYLQEEVSSGVQTFANKKSKQCTASDMSSLNFKDKW